MKKSTRTTMVNVRMNKEELTKMDKLCKKFNLNRSEVARWAIMRIK